MWKLDRVRLADSDGDGRVTGNDAIQFFSMSHLSRVELKQLISLAQAGYDLDSDILKNAGKTS
ncbi:hypothetical protein Csa_013344 [Cucumis sativus]|nr:hypothetical protein Csa_013344 [Cucumis sativus]